ncbi:MAG: hypothetical protein PHQ43_05955 [Dehalococcoidales bacterium]|nr:hypothetical protein [Dehalococcoidales bacterium]
MSILLFPVLFGVSLAAWWFPLPGGLLVLLLGTTTAVNVLSAHGWPGYYTIPYLILCAVFITGGLLHLVRAFWKRAGAARNSRT